MKKYYIFSCLFIILFFNSCKSAESKLTASIKSKFENDKTVVIDLDNKSPINNGVFEGWGTSLCWWANRVGGNEKLSNELVNLFFTMDKGIGLTIARYNIGGGDDPKHNHIIRTDSAMEGFWKNVDKSGNFEYDWTADVRQRNILKKIVSTVDEKDLIVEFFSNSPPYFMTNSGCTSGANFSFHDNIRDDMYEAFANYLAEVTYQLQIIDGVKVTSLEPMNETSSDSWVAFSNKQEGCHLTRGQNQSKLLKLTRKALDEKGLQDVIVSGCDDLGSKAQAKSFRLLSNKAKAVLGRINTHTYKNSKSSELRDIAVSNNKNLWVSETDGEFSTGSNNGQMGPALYFAGKIIEDMNYLQPSAWLIWQATAGYRADKPFNGNYDGIEIPSYTEGFWGTATTDFIEEKVWLSKKYYAFGQFTKYIRPGDYVIYTGLKDFLASYNPSSKRISIISVNPDDEEKSITFDLSSSIKSWNKIKAVRTSGATIEEGDNLSEVNVPIDSLGGGVFESSLIPYSVTTFIIEGVELL